MAQPISIFSHQKMRNQYLDFYKKRVEKFLRVLSGGAKNECWVQVDTPPLMHLSVTLRKQDLQAIHNQISKDNISNLHMILVLCYNVQHP